MNLACGILAFVLAATAPVSERDVGLGPYSLRAGFPLELGLPGYEPMAPRVEERGGVRLSLRLHRANTLAIDGAFAERLALHQEGLPQPPGYALLVDTESSRLSAELAVGLGKGWEVAAEFCAVGYSGGFGDPIIEGVHRSLGLPNGDRADRPRNEVDIMVISSSGALLQSGSPTRFSIGDTLLSVRRLLSRGGKGRSAWLAEAAVEAPTGDASRLTGSGGWDGRLGVYGSEGWGGTDFLTWGLARVFTGSQDAVPAPLPDTWQGHLGYERLWRHDWSMPVQIVATDSPMGAGADHADDPRILLQAAVRGPAIGRAVWEVGFSQNLSQNDNNADIALAAGVTWRWGGRVARPGRRDRASATKEIMGWHWPGRR